MSIRLIKDDERLTTVIEGAVFTYRRIPAHRRAKIVDDHTSKRSGSVNWGKATIGILRDSLLDWSGIEDEDGKAIPFDKALISYIPDTAQGTLMDLLGENVVQEEESKNSKTSQPSKP